MLQKLLKLIFIKKIFSTFIATPYSLSFRHVVISCRRNFQTFCTEMFSAAIAFHYLVHWITEILNACNTRWSMPLLSVIYVYFSSSGYSFSKTSPRPLRNNEVPRSYQNKIYQKFYLIVQMLK